MTPQRLHIFLAVALLMACGGDDNRPAPVDEPPDAIVETGPVTADLFGVHFVAAWASPAPLPEGITLLRIHDATERWHGLNTAEGTWYTHPDGKGLARIDALLTFRDRHAPDARTVYTLAGGGRSGTWYPEWVHPTEIAEQFRQHVRFMAGIYGESIWAVEVLNEADSRFWYDGDVSLLVELTQIVRAEWPGVVIGPSFTQDGLAMMAEFYELLPPGTVDIVAFHHGIESPERDTVAIKEAKRIAGEYPLYLTEYNVRGGAAELMRTLLVHHLYGVEAAAYYSWEMPTYYGDSDGFAHTTNTDGSLTDAGHAFLTLRDWLVGRTVTDWSAASGAWSVTLDSGERIEWTDSTMPVRR